MYRVARTELGRLWPQAILATTATVILPIIAVVSLTWLGFTLPHVLASLLGTLALAIGVAALGASLWNRRRESIDVAFGELMLWRFLKRRNAERRACRNVGEVDPGPGSSGKVIRLEHDRSLEVLHRLTLALEATDRYTLGHSRRVERHVHRTAIAMGLSTAEIRELRIAASLHDVGKICVPEQILRKSDVLTAQERSIMRDHVSVGAMMVAGAASQSVTEAILHHHEFWDGHGYPSGLSGHDIPLFARVIALADVWDAVTSARPYKGGEARAQAIEVLRDRAGSQFDPELVEVFLEALPAALPVTSALLIFLTQHRTTRPVYEWTHSSAFSDVSRAAAAGTAAAVITVGAITPQVLNEPGRDRARIQERAAVELVDLIRSRSAAMPGIVSTSWEPRSFPSLPQEIGEGGYASDSLDTVLMPPTGAIAMPDMDTPSVTPLQVPTAEPPLATIPAPIVDSPIIAAPVDPPITAPPTGVYVPPASPDPVFPVSEPPSLDLPDVSEPVADVLGDEVDEPETPAPVEADGQEQSEGPGEADGAGESEDTSGVTSEGGSVTGEDDPGHDDAGPGNSENAPGHDDAGPGNSENAPGHDDGGPGNSEDAPGHQDEAPPPPALDGAEWVSDGEQWLDETPSP